MKQFTLKELVKRKLDETYIIIYAINKRIINKLNCSYLATWQKKKDRSLNLAID